MLYNGHRYRLLEYDTRRSSENDGVPSETITVALVVLNLASRLLCALGDQKTCPQCTTNTVLFVWRFRRLSTRYFSKCIIVIVFYVYISRRMGGGGLLLLYFFNSQCACSSVYRKKKKKNEKQQKVIVIRPTTHPSLDPLV